MTLRVEFDPLARDELQAAKRWYDTERPGLGEDLLAEVAAAVERLIRLAESAPQLSVRDAGRPIRQASVRRFPFMIVYAIVDETLWVIAIAHQRRRPYYWRDRVGS